MPQWGEKQITDLEPREIELWLRNLALSPKSKAHIRAMLRMVVDYAMWCGVMNVSRNPIELVMVKGATKRTRQPRSLTVEEFQKLVPELEEPFRTMAKMAVCFGLRVSELLALKWSDVDWLNSKLRIERAIVMQNVDEVKTVASRRHVTIAKELLDVLSAWKSTTRNSEQKRIGFSPAPSSSGVCRSPIRGSGDGYKGERARLGLASWPHIPFAIRTGHGWMRSVHPLQCNRSS